MNNFSMKATNKLISFSPREILKKVISSLTTTHSHIQRITSYTSQMKLRAIWGPCTFPWKVMTACKLLRNLISMPCTMSNVNLFNKIRLVHSSYYMFIIDGGDIATWPIMVPTNPTRAIRTIACLIIFFQLSRYWWWSTIILKCCTGSLPHPEYSGYPISSAPLSIKQ